MNEMSGVNSQVHLSLFWQDNTEIKAALDDSKYKLKRHEMKLIGILDLFFLSHFALSLKSQNRVYP